LLDQSFSLHHEVHEGHEEGRTGLAKPSDFKIIFSCFVLFVSFVVGYPADQISTGVDASIVRLNTSTAVFRLNQSMSAEGATSSREDTEKKPDLG